MYKKTLPWLNDAINVQLYAPFEIDKDSDYYSDLRSKYSMLYTDAKMAGADDASLKIIDKFRKKIQDAILCYYKGEIVSSHQKIKNLVKDCIDNEFAVNIISKSAAFPGVGDEVQLFRARLGNPRGYKSKDMLHLPYSLRGKTGNYRFSIPGVPSLYLGNSSYACWIEMERPAEVEFNVSPVLLDGSQKILNLAVMNRDFLKLNDFEEGRVHSWLKLLILMLATSYRVKEEGRTFRSEYIVSQSIMLACKQLGIDGIAYYSKQVTDQVFSKAAVNLALFTVYKYSQEYSDVCKHIMIGDSFNYQTFKQLGVANTDTGYPLRTNQVESQTVIGNYNREFDYRITDFCAFDQFLFSGWDRKTIAWGNALT